MARIDKSKVTQLADAPSDPVRGVSPPAPGDLTLREALARLEKGGRLPRPPE